MSHIGSACHCLFGCDRADYEWEGECCIAWVKWHLQISDRFDQCEDVDYSSDNKHCHQEVIIFRHNGLYIACDTETCRCGVDTDQRFCRVRNFFELHIAVCYQYQQDDQSHQTEPECGTSERLFLISRSCNRCHNDTYIYDVVACEYLRHC